MAQAARLNLRMQKELKLLITDPPYGSSFPSLTTEASAASLTFIEAHFQGPEGTVYANGMFKIKIQIPERYPFQPPIVTFATPIYHPNIDNGGRICLDILNLPPKGSWQPSLNISTVLTSIGLLLSEPNPDDGLMHDASREYKYNRQAFDQKAKSMTEKYAGVGEGTSSISICEGQTHTCPLTSKAELERSEASSRVTGDFAHHDRLSSSSRMLSLESLGSSSNCNKNTRAYSFPHHDYSKNNVETEQIKEARTTGSNVIQYPDKPHPARYKLSLNVPVISHSENAEGSNTNLPYPFLEAQNTSINSREGIQNESSMQALESTKTSHVRKLVPDIAIYKEVSLSTSQNTTGHHKNDTGGKSLEPKVPEYHSDDKKENVAPIQLLLPKVHSQSNEIKRKTKLPLMGSKLPLKPLDQHSENHSNCESKILSMRIDEPTKHVCDGESTIECKKQSGSSPIPEAFIVLDSEDSEDENVQVRSKLSLARKRVLKKRKSNV